MGWWMPGILSKRTHRLGLLMRTKTFFYKIKQKVFENLVLFFFIFTLCNIFYVKSMFDDIHTSV